MTRARILSFAIAGLALVILVLNWPSKKQEVAEPIRLEVAEHVAEPLPVQTALLEAEVTFVEGAPILPTSQERDLPPDVDRMAELFQPYPSSLPFIETISYAGRVDWLTGRPAYLGDYAAHYQTSKHFISRSLHGVGNYLSDVVSKGERFNVYRKEAQIEFHLVVDLSRLKLWLYCYDRAADTKVLLKTYPVCAGKLSVAHRSGCLTPTGTFAIGNDFAVYQEGVKGNFKNETCEMVSVYGKRWIPIGREIAGCSGSSKGLGLHGVPWKRSSESASAQEQRACIGHYETGGSIRLLTEDIEELYAVIVSKPAFLHIVKDFVDADIPGKG